mmetsp:Transcript_4780/g.17147  ORF Transcript_4780/g.17147 Transcript_4780/m.17147 type:complete len:208 (-) Transcript_4780:1703-2326(-)
MQHIALANSASRRNMPMLSKALFTKTGTKSRTAEATWPGASSLTASRTKRRTSRAPHKKSVEPPMRATFDLARRTTACNMSLSSMKASRAAAKPGLVCPGMQLAIPPIADTRGGMRDKFLTSPAAPASLTFRALETSSPRGPRPCRRHLCSLVSALTPCGSKSMERRCAVDLSKECLASFLTSSEGSPPRASSTWNWLSSTGHRSTK